MSGILFGFCTRNNFDTIFYTQEGGIDASSQIPIVPRYGEHRGLIEQIVMEAVKEHLNRRQGTDNITRNFLRFLTSVCGLIEVKFNINSFVSNAFNIQGKRIFLFPARATFQMKRCQRKHYTQLKVQI